MKTHVFFGVMLDNSLAWTVQDARLKREVLNVVQPYTLVVRQHVRVISSLPATIIRCTFRGITPLQPTGSLGMSRASLKILESIKAQALRAYLGLPQTASTVDILAEGRALLIGAMRTQETAHTHLRHVARHQSHKLAHIAVTFPRSALGAVTGILRSKLRLNFEAALLPRSPPWLYDQIKIFFYIHRV